MNITIKEIKERIRLEEITKKYNNPEAMHLGVELVDKAIRKNYNEVGYPIILAHHVLNRKVHPVKRALFRTMRLTEYLGWLVTVIELDAYNNRDIEVLMSIDVIEEAFDEYMRKEKISF